MKPGSRPWRISAASAYDNFKRIHPEETGFFVVEVHEIESHPSLTGRGDGNLPAPLGERLQARLKKRPPNHIQDEVGSFASRQFLDRFRQGTRFEIDPFHHGKIVALA